MDLSDSIIPKSDQLNAEDLLTGPRTFTIETVTKGSAEQPFDFHLMELPGRAYRPSKTMRRVIVMAWGPETVNYAGKRLTLFRNPEIKYGGVKVGGIEISHMSNLVERFALSLTETRGKRASHVIEPLTDPQPVRETEPTAHDPEPTADQIAACIDLEELRAMYGASTSPEGRAQIRARKAELLEFDGPNVASAVS